MLEVRKVTKAGLQICNEVLNKGKCVDQEYQLFEQLALSYLNPDDHHDYPKAVGIYEYMKYLDRSKEEELDKRVLRAEEKFLQKINGCPGKIKSTKPYAEILRFFRDEISEELTRVDHKAMEKTHLRTRGFIIGEIIIPLIDDCIGELGGLPKVNDRDAKYSIFCTGSIALGTMTPWSDLEFGILLEDGLTQEDYTRVKAYFINLTHLLNIKVLTFGENVLHYQGIQELNDFSTGNIEDNWFVDTLTTKGFCFDAALPDGSKTPFGRKGCKGVRDYELIGTVEELTRFQKEEEGWHESDPSLVQALNHVGFIYGDEELFNRSYLEALKEFSEINRERAFRILREDAEKLNPVNELIDVDRAGTILNVKKEIYRFPDRMIVALGDCLRGEGNTTWDIIDSLVTQGKLKNTAADNLKHALNIATELRLKTYSNNKGRKEDISALAKYDSGVEELQEVEEAFHLKDLEILYGYYYVTFKLVSIVTRAANSLELEQAIGVEASLYGNHPLVMGIICSRFLRYEQAIKEFEKILEVEGYGLKAKLIQLYCNVERFNNALVLGRELLEEAINSKDQRKIAFSYNLLGDILSKLGQYDESSKCLKNSLKIEQTVHDEDSIEIAISLNNYGAHLATMGKYEDALTYYRQALKVAKKLYPGRDKLCIANYFSNIGQALENLGLHEEALRKQLKSLGIQRRIYKGIHPNIVYSLSSIGTTFASWGKYEQALKYYQESLKMANNFHGDGESNLLIAGCLNNIGEIYRILGRYDEAKKKHLEALEMIERVCIISSGKRDSSSTANYLNGLGATFANLGEWQEALPNHQRALEIYSKIYGKNHPCIALTLSTIGDVFVGLGQYKKSKEIYKRALKISKEVYKKNHEHTCLILNNLANTLAKSGKDKKALKIHQEVLVMNKDIHNKEHISIATSLNNIGSIFGNLERYEEALEKYKDSLEMKKRVYKDDHPSITITLSNIGKIFENLERYEEALDTYNEALVMNRRLYGENHPSILTSLDDIQTVFLSLRKYEEVLASYQESLKIAKDKGDHNIIIKYLNNIGNILVHLQRYTDATIYYRDGLENIDVDQKESYENAELLHNLASAYEMCGRYEDALPPAQQAAQMFKRITPYRDLHVKRSLGLFLSCLLELVQRNKLSISPINKDELLRYNNPTNYYYMLCGVAFELLNFGHTEWAILCQELAVQYAPEPSITNHNLACMYHVKALVEMNAGKEGNFGEYRDKASITFKESISYPNSTAAVHVEYAMFLLKYHEQGNLEEYQKIVLLLEQAMSKQDRSGLGYGQVDKMTTMWALRESLDMHEEISIKSSVLANYFLCKVHKMYGKVEDAQKSLEALIAISMPLEGTDVYAIAKYLLEDVEKITEINPDLNRLVNMMPTSTPPDLGITSTGIGNVLQVDTSISMAATNISTPNQTQDQSSSLRR
ncbi:MAG: hypothetical protein K0R73_683 [Candidatus Midichloriaceae bacterium]|jgi:tetratricopeptide (TPR) repeat protein|nr:hypothetical protein [Candidatus Midichloriaceae bacterium]